MAHVARLLADAGIVALAPLISPYREARARAREVHEQAGLPFVEVYVNTPIEECERRDPKGLYERARRGEITGFTGVDDAYEAPVAPDLEIAGGDASVEDAAAQVLELLRSRGVLAS